MPSVLMLKTILVFQTWTSLCTLTCKKYVQSFDSVARFMSEKLTKTETELPNSMSNNDHFYQYIFVSNVIILFIYAKFKCLKS